MVKSRSAVSDLPVGERKRRLTLISSIAGAFFSIAMVELLDKSRRPPSAPRPPDVKN